MKIIFIFVFLFEQFPAMSSLSISSKSSNSGISGRYRKLSKIAAEELQEKERKAAAKSIKKTKDSKKRRAEEDGNTKKSKKSLLAAEAAKILKEAVEKAKQDEADAGLSGVDDDNVSEHGSLGPLTEDDRISAALEDFLAQRMSSSGSATPLWPTKLEMSAAISGMAVPAITATKIAPMAGLFVQTVGKLSLNVDSAILSLAVICEGSRIPPGTVFFTLPDDTAEDKNIHDFYQVRGIPSSRLDIRKATKIITSRGDATATGNLMDINDIVDVLFGPTDNLCTLPVGGVTHKFYI